MARTKEQERKRDRKNSADMEAILSMGSSALLEPLAGLAGIAGSLWPGAPGQGARAVKSVQDLAYEPRNKATLEQIASAVEKPLKTYGKVMDAAGDKTMQVTGSPLLGSVVGHAPEHLLTLLGGAGPLRSLGNSVKLMRDLENALKGLSHEDIQKASQLEASTNSWTKDQLKTIESRFRDAVEGGEFKGRIGSDEDLNRYIQYNMDDIQGLESPEFWDPNIPSEELWKIDSSTKYPRVGALPSPTTLGNIADMTQYKKGREIDDFILGLRSTLAEKSKLPKSVANDDIYSATPTPQSVTEIPTIQPDPMNIFSTTTTGRTKWDELLASDKGNVEYMSPDQLMSRMAKGQGTTVEKATDKRMNRGGQEKIDKLLEVMQTQPGQMNIPILDYADGGFVQDGFHRALAAKQMGLKTVPVGVIRR